MKRSIPKRSRCPTLKSPQSTSSATLSMATGTTRSHLGEELIDLFFYGQFLRLHSLRWQSRPACIAAMGFLAQAWQASSIRGHGLARLGDSAPTVRVVPDAGAGIRV